MKAVKFQIICLVLLLIASCGNNSSNKNSFDDGINGRYSYTDNSAEIFITISGSTWSGKTILISGMGSEYDNQNAQYDNGILKGNELYESSGIVKIGYVSGKLLYTNVGGQNVTLRKK